MKLVNEAIPKLDSGALTSGKGVYTDDIAPADCLVVKVLRSPHAYARIRGIKKTAAGKVPGVVAVLTWEDVLPQKSA